jgi:tetratricopeptide (TPR) repeat protein
MISLDRLRKTPRAEQLEALRLAVAQGLPADDAKQIARADLGWSREMIARLARNPVAEALQKLGGIESLRDKQRALDVRLRAKQADLEVKRVTFLPIRVVEPEAVTNGWIKLGIDLDGDRLYDVARKAFREVLASRDPAQNDSHGDALNRIGLTFHHEARDARALGKKAKADRLEAKAIECYRKAFRLDPSDDSPLYNIACSQIVLGRTQAALGTLARSIEVARTAAMKAPPSERASAERNVRATIELLQGDDDLKPLRAPVSEVQLGALIAECQAIILELKKQPPE